MDVGESAFGRVISSTDRSQTLHNNGQSRTSEAPTSRYGICHLAACIRVDADFGPTAAMISALSARGGELAASAA